MNTTILQVPMDKDFKNSVQKRAEETGFSSLQDFLRFVMTQFLNSKFTVSVAYNEPDEILTPEQDKLMAKKYKQAMTELSRGKFKSARNVDDFMKQLDEDGIKAN